MTPDQLPPGVRVKRPTWTTDAGGVSIAEGTAYHITAPEEKDDPDGRFTLWCGEHDVSEHATLEDAQHAMYIDLVANVCAHLEIEPSSPAVIAMPNAEEIALRKDADRYRWLRKPNEYEPETFVLEVAGVGSDGLLDKRLHLEELDSAIDAALKEQTQ